MSRYQVVFFEKENGEIPAEEFINSPFPNKEKIQHPCNVRTYFSSQLKNSIIVMRTLDNALAEQMKRPNFKKEYEALEAEFAIVQAIINARKHSGLTQGQLAEKTGIAQSDISKLENGNSNPSLRTLQRLASGINMQLKIEFVPYPEDTPN